jgi:proteasome component ECM29
MAAEPDKTKELQLINKLEFRIALEKNEQKLQTLLGTYLTPLLLKLKSPHPEVQQKTIEVLQHIQTRIETSEIQLPVQALLDQLRAHGDARLLRVLDARFIRIGISRINSEEEREHILINGILKDMSKFLLDLPDVNVNNLAMPADGMEAEKTSPVGPYLLHFLFSILCDYQIPRRGDKRNETYRAALGIEHHDGYALSKWFAKLLLLPMAHFTTETPPRAHPGLSKADLEYLVIPELQNQWNPNVQFGLTLAKVKARILDFVETGAFTESERQWVFLFATPETCSTAVSERGNTYFRAGGAKLQNPEDVVSINRLFKVFPGDDASGMSWALPLSLRTRVLQLLTGPKLTLSPVNAERVAKILAYGIEKVDGGLPAQRFNTAFLSFCTWLFRSSSAFRGTKDTIDGLKNNLTAEKLVQEMKDYLCNTQGWPTSESSVDLGLRGKLYQVIGIAAQEANLRDISLLNFLFQSLNEDKSGGDVLMYVEDALSAMTLTFSKHKLSNEEQVNLEDFLLHALQTQSVHKSHLFRLTRFANRCLPYSNEAARYIDIVVSGSKDAPFEAIEEGRNALNPYLFRTENLHRPDLWSISEDTTMSDGVKDSAAFAFSFPRYDRLIDLFFDKDSQVALQPKLDSISRQKPATLRTMVRFVYRILVSKVLGPENCPPIDANWEASIDTLLSTDAAKRKAFKRNLTDVSWAKPSAIRSILTILLASLQTFSMDTSPDAEDCQKMFVQILSVLPTEMFSSIIDDIPLSSLMQALQSHNSSTRDSAARGFGILAAISSKSEDHINELMAWAEEKSSGPAVHRRCGAIIGLSHFLCRINALNESERVSKFPFQDLHSILVASLSTSKERALLDAVYTSVGQLAIWGVYGSVIKLPTESRPDDLTAGEIMEKIHEKAKSGDEKAITAIGRFSVWSDEEVLLRKTYDYLYCYHELRQTEAHFAVGEAICCVAFGSENSALEVEFDITEPNKAPLNREDLQKDVLEKTLTGCKQSKPSLRRASLIWLLSLVKFGGANEFILSNLEKCHHAFKASLGHRDELVQEAAARGLGLIYERANKDLKETLVKDLLSTFSSRQSNLAGTVSQDTELFQEGVVGSGENSISTYRQILDLANEAGNPSLVYQFMSIAADNEIWTSRAAFGKFGLSNIFADADMEDFLAKNPKLLPTLYRYQFDPSPAIQDYMRTLWKAMIKDPTATIDQNYDQIITHLLKTMMELRWRDIEASYLAIIDLVQGRRFEQYEKYLREIWQNTARGLDHIKSSVRIAAGKLAHVLTNVLVRTVESEEGAQKAHEMADHVIPFLLSQTGPSANPESKQFASSTIIKLCKKSKGKVIEKYIPELISTMIKLFTDMEPDVVNWMHLNASKLKLSTKDLDEIRLNSGVKNSPLMEAIEKLIDNVYEKPETVEAIVKVVDSSARVSVGMPSLAGTSRIIVVMMVRYHARYRQYADDLLKSIRKPLFDRNDTVCSSFAYSAGYIARWASDKYLLNFIDWIWGHWRDSTSDRDRGVAAEVFLMMSKYAPEHCANLADPILPYIFIGKHDSQEDVKETFTAAWAESTGGQRAILLHLDAIVKLAVSLLDHQKWSVKHAAARAVGDTAIAVAGLEGMAAKEEAKKVWPAFVAAMGGKSWDGKEVVLKAFVEFVEKIRGFWESDAKVAAEINKVRFKFPRSLKIHIV